MTILSAKFSNPDGSIVEALTDEAGSVLIPVSGEDFSGGWQAVFETWCQQGGQVEAFVDDRREPIENFMQRHGFGLFQLLDLKDLEDKLRAASIEIPAKAAAVRVWIDSVRVSYVTNQHPANPPHAYDEVVAEAFQQLTQ